MAPPPHLQSSRRCAPLLRALKHVRQISHSRRSRLQNPAGEFADAATAQETYERHRRDTRRTQNPGGELADVATPEKACEKHRRDTKLPNADSNQGLPSHQLTIPPRVQKSVLS